LALILILTRPLVNNVADLPFTVSYSIFGKLGTRVEPVSQHMGRVSSDKVSELDSTQNKTDSQREGTKTKTIERTKFVRDLKDLSTCK